MRRQNLVRGLAAFAVVVSLAVPVQARPSWDDFQRGRRDITKVMKKWVVAALGDGLTLPWPTKP